MKFTPIRVAVLNMAGGVGKSTLSRHGIAPQIPGSVLVCVEDWNSGDGKADLQISASKFYDLVPQINTDDLSLVLDTGTSNVRPMLKHFSDLDLTRERFDIWLIPTRAGAKEKLDTLKTIQLLIEMGIDPSKIVVIAVAVNDVGQFEYDFGPIMLAAKQNGFHFAEQPVLFNAVYDMLKGGDRSVFDIVAARPDFDALRAQARGDEKRMVELGKEMLVYSLALTATRNLRAVFASTTLPSLMQLEVEHA
jgi:hypothetical protein